MSDTILDQIITSTRELTALRKSRISEETLRLRARSLPATRDFHAALSAPAGAGRGANIIAEVKKASPSKGLIRPDFHPVDLVRDLAENGAAAISVLTEPSYFQGDIRFLRLVGDNVDVPVLRKDFIVSEYQLYEARVFGADAVLLIAAALDDEQLAHLYSIARGLTLDVLLEVHDQAELERALAVEPDIVGVNARDLKTFQVDLNVTAEIIRQIPEPIVKVAESGIKNGADIANLRRFGANAFLIGETFMREPAPGAKLKQLLAQAAGRK